MATNLKSILKLEVPVSVQIATRNMSMREVANLAPGALIELPKLADEELEIVVSNRQIGVGTAVKVGENFGVRVNYIGDLKSRIKALAGEAVPVQDPATDEATSPDSEDADEPTEQQPQTQADGLVEQDESQS